MFSSSLTFGRVGGIALRRGLRSSATIGVEKPKNLIGLKNNFTVVAGNGVIVAWHPNQPFPYEHTRPLPAAEQTERVLKVDGSPLSDELQEKYRSHFYERKGRKTFWNVDLMRMLYMDRNSTLTKYRYRRIEQTVTPTEPYRKGI